MFHHIAVLGAGTMGHGIAELLACHGLHVTIYDPHREALEKAQHKIIDHLQLRQQREQEQERGQGQGQGQGQEQREQEQEQGQEQGQGQQREQQREQQEQRGQHQLHDQQQENTKPASMASIAQLIAYTVDLQQAVQGADLIIEAAPEQLEIKRELYQRLAPLLKADAIVASNTSTYALEILAEGQPFGDRMIITHFFNPAPLVPLVEIVSLEHTRERVVEKVVQLLTGCGKEPVVLHKDIPGFIANRLQAAVMREACYLLANGIADAKQIDLAMTAGPGMRWAISGPFENSDYGGLDVWEKVTGHLFPLLDVSSIAPDVIRSKVRNGQLGVKSGSGIYDYGSAEQRQQSAEARDAELWEVLQLKRKK